MPQEQADQFFPSPTILCPMSGDPIINWTAIEESFAGKSWYEKDENAKVVEVRENQNQVQEFKEDFRIEGFSPTAQGGKLRVRVHCFIEDGEWVHSEICEVKNIDTNVMYYSTDEESPEVLYQKLKAKQAQSE